MSIIFDIGANDGESTIALAESDKANMVYAFEPNPSLCQLLKAKTAHLQNYVLVPKAVSDFNGFAKFNITGKHKQACSSLFNYTDNVNKIWHNLGYRFKVTEVIDIEVTTMEKFIDENTIPIINYFHCDAQGGDLKILKSFGKHIALVQSGVVEVSRLPETSTYYVDNTFDSLKKFFDENNFEITKIESDNRKRNELDVYFSNQNTVIKKIQVI